MNSVRRSVLSLSLLALALSALSACGDGHEHKAGESAEEHAKHDHK